MKLSGYKIILLGCFVFSLQYLFSHEIIADYHIKKQIVEDEKIRESIKPFFAERKKAGKDQSAEKKYRIVQKKCKKHGAQKVFLKTAQRRRLFPGKVSVAALYREVEDASFNLVIVPGWFHGWTPPKEWCAPYFGIFSRDNVYTFDWPGVNESDGSNPFLLKNSFGTNSWVCIQRLLEFVRGRNKKPIILYGFCFGAAMVLHATVMAQRHGKQKADAIGLGCIFAKASDMFEYNMKHIDNPFYAFLRDLGFDKWIVSNMNNGSFFDLNPIKMIKEIMMPCFFDFYTKDKVSPFQEGVKVYHEAKKDSRYLCLSDVGSHVRIAPHVPYQWRASMYDFFWSKVMPSVSKSKL